ncbi:MAG: FHA domain-containing protein, partial [Myxococcaceae bacterium]
MKLVIEDDEGHRREVPLDRDEVTIGRQEDNVVHLPERNVSRRHARLLRQGDTVLLEDLRSANGTHVNGMRISEQVPLGDGDTVRIGDYGVAIRPDGVPLEAPLPWTVAAEPQAFPRTDVLADTAPHPLVVTAAEPAIEVQLPDASPRRPRRAVAVVGLGLLLGLGGALVLRARSGDASRARSAVPPPPTPEVVDEVIQPPAAAE